MLSQHGRATCPPDQAGSGLPRLPLVTHLTNFGGAIGMAPAPHQVASWLGPQLPGMGPGPCHVATLGCGRSVVPLCLGLVAGCRCSRVGLLPPGALTSLREGRVGCPDPGLRPWHVRYQRCNTVRPCGLASSGEGPHTRPRGRQRWNPTAQPRRNTARRDVSRESVRARSAVKFCQCSIPRALGTARRPALGVLC